MRVALVARIGRTWFMGAQGQVGAPTAGSAGASAGEGANTGPLHPARAGDHDPYEFAEKPFEHPIA